jgi:hypothetical protein
VSLELAKESFLEGYRLAKLHERPTDAGGLAHTLANLGVRRAPFAFEGAAMAWRLRDAKERHPSFGEALLQAGCPRWRTFIHLGAGCALARLGLPPPSDPVALDGFGFQRGLTAGVSGLGVTSPEDRSARGRGRALWFVTGGAAEACQGALEAVVNPGELWRGVGTACTFAGDPRGHAILLSSLAGLHAEELRQGANEALALWRSLGDPPSRALRAAVSLGSVL